MTDAKHQAEVVWNIGNRHGSDADRKQDIAESLEVFAESIRAEATLAEKERCAKAAKKFEDSTHNTTNTVRAIIAAIRAGAPRALDQHDTT